MFTWKRHKRDFFIFDVIRQYGWTFTISSRRTGWRFSFRRRFTRYG